MKRRKISQIETEEALKLIQNIDRPIEKKALKKLLTKIVKSEFVSTGNRSSVGNSVFLTEIFQTITCLIETWSSDISIALLLVNLLQKLMASLFWGDAVANELCKPPGQSLIAIIEVFKNKASDLELKTSICDVILEILKHDNAAESIGQSTRIKIRRQLLDFISNHRENSTIMELALASIYHLLCGSSINEVQKFSTLANIESVVGVCKGQLAQGSHLKEACKVLGLLIEADSQNPILLSEAVIKIMLRTMQHNDDDLIINQVACHAITNFSEDKEICEIIEDNGGSALIAKAVRSFPQSSSLVLDWLCYLENAVGVTYQVADDASFLREIFDAMVTHQDDARVQESACRAVIRLLNVNPSAECRIGEDEGQFSVHNCVVATMHIHINDPYVFQTACGALHEMATASIRLQQLLVAKGSYVTIVDHMRGNKEASDIQEWGFRALRALCYKNVLQEEILVKYELLTDIKDTLHVYCSKDGVLEEALSLLACLAADMEIVRRQCILELIHDRVVEIMKTHNNSVPLLKTCFETLAVFAASEEQSMLTGVLDSVEQVMRKYRACPGLQVNGCILIQLLANDEVCENPLLWFNIVNLVCEAISNFPCEEEVQTEGVVALKVIAESEMGCRELIKQDGYQYIFKIMNSLTLPTDVLRIAAEGLLLMCHQQHYRDRILQWAVINDRFKEALWLLRNGADVNSGSLDKPNLLVAAEMKNPQMVSFLLEHGASHVQEALQITRRQANDKLTGILLRQIGLEKKSGVLAWGNLNIKELKSVYFSPSLIGKPDSNSAIVENECWNDHFEVASKNRQLRFSSTDLTRYSRLDSNSSEYDREEITGASIKCTRPNSLTGAVLPFVNMDPRVEGPLDPYERFVRLDSPVLCNSYPGYPNSLLIPDATCGSLLPSPEKETLTKSASFERAASAFPSLILQNHGDSSEDSPMVKNKQKKLSRKISAQECHSRLQYEAKEFIKFADMSCNSLSSIKIFSAKRSIMNSFFNGLSGLDLRFNKLKYLEEEVCHQLKQLKKLNLEGNELESLPYAILLNGTIETLNLRKNAISQLDNDQLKSCITLTNLDISNNRLTSFPALFGELFPALKNLSLSGNQISKLPVKAVELAQLNQLDLSHNQIEAVPGQFLERCISLTKLNLSHNCLISLPDTSLVTCNRLSNLRVSHNNLAERAPLYVPKFVLQLPNLICLDMSHNNIFEIPAPSMWASRSLKELNFDHNRIRKVDLNNSAANWSSLYRLSIVENKLENLPRQIGLLKSLCYLNISHNPIKTIPDELGKLRNSLQEFPLDGLSLDLPPSILKGTAREICTFLYSRMKQAVRYLHMKLMVVGREGRGKSTLLRTLKGIKNRKETSPTVGIEIKTWNLPIPKNHWAREQRKEASFILSTWDYAGQEDFFRTHQCFLSSRALYLAVYDASKGPDDLESLRSWLLNINAAAPGASVILVGTNADNVKTDNKKSYFGNLQSRITEFMKNPGFPTCRGSAIVCAARSGSDIDALRGQILESVAKLAFREESSINKTVPKSYVQMDNILKEEANRLLSNSQIPVISMRSLVKITQDNNLSLEKDELEQAVKFLHESGSLLHYDDPLLKLEDCYFIHPEWLSQMLVQVITVKEINHFVDEKGVLRRTDVPLLFRGEKFPETFIDNYLSLLQKFEVVIPLGEEKFLIPSKLPVKPSGFTERVTMSFSQSHKTLSRFYKFAYIPVSLWSRLISRLMLFQSPLQDEEEKMLVVEYWRDGIFRFWTEEKYFVVTTSESFANTLEIVVPVSQGGYELLGYLVDHIDTLIEEWYPGLSSADPRGRMYIERFVQCTHCQLLNKAHCFPLEMCISQSYVSDSIWCPTHKDDVFLRDIAPDVLLADIDGKFLINENELEQKEGEGVALGGGSFGSVYQTRYKGTINVAVKVFKAGGNIVPHRYLRQEVNILRHLRHPSLVSMLGVCLRPSRCLVMELAQIGSLRKVLTNGHHLSRGMQHRIASQVCEGLAHLHKHDIVYRDMKPSNILIFSLSMGITVNAKISDYGISQYVTPSGFPSSGGTPGYRAPEVIRGDCLYNKEADIFSFGITLYELVTRGKKPFGESQFQCDLDSAALSKSGVKPITSVGCSRWPDIEDIISNCLESKPDKRSTAQAISQWLLSADTLCLKQEIVVCKGQTVECMAVHRSRNSSQENLELWIASGDSSSGHSQISWFPLTKKEKKVQGCRGTILRDKHILCICAISDNLILAGTKKGHIIAFDCDSHEMFNDEKLSESSVICLKLYSDQRENLVLAGLANGQLAIYHEKHFRIKDGKRPLLMDVFSHSKSNEPAPITCMEVYRRKCYIGYGSSIAVVDVKQSNVDYFMDNCGEEGRNIRQIAIHHYLWVISKDSSTVRCLNVQSGKCLGSFNCCDVLKQRFPGISERDCRTVSMYSRQDALWIGCGSGHIIILEPNLSFKVLTVVSRHSSAVRCIIGACSVESGKSISLVLTGGVGFRERSQSTENEENTSGYVLVWDSELPSQDAYLKTVQKSRDDLLEK